MKRALSYIFAVILFLAAYPQSATDSVKVYFKVGSSRFEPMLDDNLRRMEEFMDNVRKAERKGWLDHIEIRAYASPEGNSKSNIRIADRRGRTVEEYIISATGVSSDLVSTFPGTIAWDELTQLVKVTPDVPAREQVLEILENTPEWVFDSRKRIVDGRKKQLMELRGGRPYNWMMQHLFPKLRNAVAVTLCLKPEKQTEAATKATSSLSSDSLLTDSSSIDSSHAESSSIEFTLPQSSPTHRQESVKDICPVCPDNTAEAAASKTIPAPRPRQTPDRHLFALKTNLLYYALLMPNLELEWLISDKWSVAAIGDVAFWSDREKNKIYQLVMLSLEGRRWFPRRAPWHGLYVGLMAGVGWYDLLNGGPGYRGEGVMGGPTVGYMWPIGRHFSLEGELGVGVMHTWIKEYEPRDGHHMFTRNRKLTYFGPLRLKFSIAWRFGNHYKKETNNSYNED